MRIVIPALGCLLFFACHSRDVEAPPYRPDTIDMHPISTYLSPKESMSTIHLPEGYHLQLVASEPDIQEPVALTWDGDGRMYVAEMRSYMQDINGTGEHLPICRITRLEDTDGDGVMDKHTVFIDSLVLPRMMLAVEDRLIVSETYTYNLYSYRDSNGDGIADEKKLVYHNDTADNANLEHQKSGLIWNTDNWIYVTANPVRYRYEQGMLDVDTMADPAGGQWGLTHDDYGRLYYSSAGGEIPALNFEQNPVYGQLNLDSERRRGFDSVWPIIATPDVQGGQERLRKDSTLNHFTASCGQCIFRGDRLPVGMRGDLFICEPVGRLIRRAKADDKNGEIILRNAYNSAEFLTSSDMNFRPVNLYTGPDGCLYIVDMYHGIIQESNWTKQGSYLRPQIQRKNLDKNIGRGRIYRLVHDGYTPGPRPQLLEASSAQLVDDLSHPNGWWRDNAEELLVVRQDKSVVPALKQLVVGGTSSPLTRVLALWTLDGLHAVDQDLLLTAFKDGDPQVRKAAVRISESFLARGDAGSAGGSDAGGGDEAILRQLASLTSDTSADVRIQVALSLRYSRSMEAKAILKTLLAHGGGNELLTKSANRSLDEGDSDMIVLKEKTARMNYGEKHLIYTGATNFKQLCATCHGLHGEGLPSRVAPPLAGAAEVSGNPRLLIRILLNGLSGTVGAKDYGVMPAQNSNNDEYIASVLSYIRNSMGNTGAIVRPSDVRDVRKADTTHPAPWTWKELHSIKP
jgi:glucose/arabinose dehydrogenase/mono/diheme cytochrome c family protein